MSKITVQYDDQPTRRNTVGIPIEVEVFRLEWEAQSLLPIGYADIFLP